MSAELGQRGAWHRPELYRYEVGRPGIRALLNHYGWDIIGIAIVVGRFAYCVKWKWAR